MLYDPGRGLSVLHKESVLTEGGGDEWGTPSRATSGPSKYQQSSAF